MAKSQNAFIKNEKEKRRFKKKQEKQQKKSPPTHPSPRYPQRHHCTS
jgi:hypothetical protein